MKKFINAAIVAAVCFSLAACGSSSSSADTEAAAAEASSSEESSQRSSEGETKGRIAYIVGSLGGTSPSLIQARPVWRSSDLRAGRYVQLRLVIPQTLTAMRTTSLTCSIRAMSYIVGYSTYMEIMADLAPEYPDVKFVGFDQNWDEQLPQKT